MGSEHVYDLAAAGGLISTVFLLFFWLFWTDPPRRARRALKRRSRPISALKNGQMATVEGKLRHRDPATARDPEEPLYRQLRLEVFLRKVGSDGAVTEGWESLAESVSANPARIEEDGSALLINLKSCVPAFEGELRPIDWSNPSSDAKALAQEASTLDTHSPARLRLRQVLAEDTIRIAGKVTEDSHGTLHLVAPSQKVPLALGKIPGPSGQR